jgi:hypothetical protein
MRIARSIKVVAKQGKCHAQITDFIPLAERAQDMRDPVPEWRSRANFDGMARS